MDYYYFDIDKNKRIGYNSLTEFVVQVGRKNSAYKTKHKFRCSLKKALDKYNGIELKNKAKKRLAMIGKEKLVVIYKATA